MSEVFEANLMDSVLVPDTVFSAYFSGRLFALFFTRGCIMEPIIDFNRAIGARIH